MQNFQRIIVITSVVWLTLFTNHAMAERPVLEMIPFEMPVGISEIIVPTINIYRFTPTDIDISKMDNDLVVRRRDLVEYDEKTGIYSYTFWEDDGTRMEIRHELEDRVLVSVQCQVSYDEGTQEYVYTYRIDTSPHSPQPLQAVIFGINSDVPTRVNSSHDWHFFSADLPRPKDRIFFGSLANDVLPGETLIIALHSPYGPVIVPIYAQGIAQRFPRPAHLGKEAFARHPPTVEGVHGKTLGPGVVTPEDCEALLRAALEEGRTWEWLDDSTYQTIMKTMTEAVTFSEALSTIRKLKESLSLEPEFQAILAHVIALNSQ